MTEYLGQTDGGNLPRIIDVSEYPRSDLELVGWLLIEVMQTYQTDLGERRQRVAWRLSALQIHRPKAVMEFRYLKAAVRH